MKYNDIKLLERTDKGANIKNQPQKEDTSYKRRDTLILADISSGTTQARR